MGRLESGGCCRKAMLHRAGWIWGARATADGVQSLARVVVWQGGAILQAGTGQGKGL